MTKHVEFIEGWPYQVDEHDALDMGLDSSARYHTVDEIVDSLYSNPWDNQDGYGDDSDRNFPEDEETESLLPPVSTDNTRLCAR